MYPHSTDAAFPILWSDVSATPWPTVIEKLALPNDAPVPQCEINFSSLTSLAREAARQSPEGGAKIEWDVIEGRKTDSSPVNMGAFFESSSPQVDLPSGGTVPSDEERQLDPDYYPAQI